MHNTLSHLLNKAKWHHSSLDQFGCIVRHCWSDKKKIQLTVSRLATMYLKLTIFLCDNSLSWRWQLKDAVLLADMTSVSLTTTSVSITSSAKSNCLLVQVPIETVGGVSIVALGVTAAVGIIVGAIVAVVVGWLIFRHCLSKVCHSSYVLCCCFWDLINGFAVFSRLLTPLVGWQEGYLDYNSSQKLVFRLTRLSLVWTSSGHCVILYMITELTLLLPEV